MPLLRRIAIAASSIIFVACSDDQAVMLQAHAVEAQGFVVTENPTSNRVALLVEIGKIRAKLDVYKTSASLYTASPSPYSPGISDAEMAEWQSMLTSSVNQSTIDAYQAIESLIEAQQGADIMTMLTRLASPQSVTTASDNSRDNRDAKRIEYETARGVEDRLDMISDEIFPTRKEYFLVASALLRLGGDHATKAISASGKVVDLYQLLMAAGYNYIADKSHPRWISYCKGQSEPLAKLDEGLDHISAKAAANEQGMQLEVSASDFYQLASNAQTVSAGLPTIDEQICE